MSNKEYETKLVKKQHYETGATRDEQSGKGRYDLIPDVALKRVALVYERGGENHGDRNWEKGLPFSRLYNSAMRHLRQAREAYYNEDLRAEDHLAHSVWNMFAIMFNEFMIDRGCLPEELNDCPKYPIPEEVNKETRIESNEIPQPRHPRRTPNVYDGWQLPKPWETTGWIPEVPDPSFEDLDPVTKETALPPPNPNATEELAEFYRREKEEIKKKGKYNIMYPKAECKCKNKPVFKKVK